MTEVNQSENGDYPSSPNFYSPKANIEEHDSVNIIRNTLNSRQKVGKVSTEVLDENTENPDVFKQSFTPPTNNFRTNRTQTLRYTPEGVSFNLLRWPLMILIMAILGLELVCYVITRQLVNVWEYYFIWRGVKRKLRARIRASKTYAEWYAAASDLDTFMGKNAWKTIEQCPFYEDQLIKKTTSMLSYYRSKKDHARLRDLMLQGSIKNNLGGIENKKLYSMSYFGTKKLIEDYYFQSKNALEDIAESPTLTLDEKYTFFKRASKMYGRTALCLSGGAAMGYYHIGVIKALLEHSSIPTVITGTSAGSLVGACISVRTDEELSEVLKPELCERLHPCEDSWLTMLKRFLKVGACYDPNDWAAKLQWLTKGNTTFREAFEMTGRIFNVTCIPVTLHAPPKTLNYITAPDCVIWSAVLASAAVPGLLNPVTLLMKNPDGTLTPFLSSGSRWRDGGLRTDIPFDTLHSLFNITYTIVSQVNPHIILFFYNHQGSVGRPAAHRQGKGWRGGFISSAVEHFLKLSMLTWLKLLRDLQLLPNFLDQDWSRLWLQKFNGSVTIIPRVSVNDYYHILSDPNYSRLEKYIQVGSMSAWPKLHMINNRLMLERRVLEYRKFFRNELNNREQNSSQTRSSLVSLAYKAGANMLRKKQTEPERPLNKKDSTVEENAHDIEEDEEKQFLTMNEESKD